MRHARVVAGRQPISAELAHDVAHERLEFHVVVARDAGVRRLALRVRVDEAVDDVAPEYLRVVERVERDAEHRRRAPGVLACLFRPAATRRVGVATRLSQTHPHTDDVVPALGEQRGGHGRVHAAAHRDEDPAQALTAAVPRTRLTTFGSVAMKALSSASVLTRSSWHSRDPLSAP